MRKLSRVTCVGAFVLSWGALGAAAPLLDLSGRVELLDGVAPDGVRVVLGLDLDRDGDLNSFETVTATVASDGSYKLDYTPDPTKVDFEFIQFVAELLSEYEARGFEAALDDGPLPVIVRFEREGYSTVVGRVTTQHEAPHQDVVLSPLAPVSCAGETCMAPDGSVRISGFPGGTGIDRAYSRAYDPRADGPSFPGAFADDDDNLLISSGFAEINLHDSSGNPVTRLSSPVDVRFESKPDSWAALRDLEPDSGLIEVPMYSFDEASGEWVSEAPGQLETASGVAIEEASFPSILDGSYDEKVYVSFRTSHFSTFNCDAPVNERACVKGRLTVNGEAVVGVAVGVEGVSYTGSAGTVYTGADGSFASDVMKSEVSGQDVDGNGARGETFQARIVASGVVGVHVGEAFDTPAEQSSIEAGSVTCRPADCDCVDLGDIEVEFETARACEVTVNVTYSGKHLIGSGGPLASGDAVPDTNVTGKLTGSMSAPLDPSLCTDLPCKVGRTDADGAATFIVPVLGDAPKIELRTSFSVEDGGDIHYYEGSVTIDGCARDEGVLTGSVDLELTHSSLGDLGGFIQSLGDGPAVPDDDDQDPLFEAPKAPGCACRTAPPARGFSGWVGFALAVFGVAYARRRARLDASRDAR
jgi:hypothetical protein